MAQSEQPEQPITLEERMARLERLLAAQCERSEQQQAEIAAQRAEIARLRAAAAPALPLPLPVAASPARATDEPEPAAPSDARPTGGHHPSRRALLKLGSAAAAAGVAAGVAAAVASNGSAQAHTDAATITYTASGPGNIAIEGDGTSSAYGIKGTNDGAGIGVWGYATGPFGWGVAGVSTQSYGGYFSGGQAPLALAPGAAVGAPSLGNHGQGEIYVDLIGVLWYCAVSGTPGLWFRLTGVVNGIAGGALNYLPAPIRLFDSRLSATAPLPVSKGALSGNTAYTIQVTGTDVGGIHVPAGAAGVFGNLTVT
ncbi:MAG TPA: hypothetical protein VGR57_15200, partial [Ktedonobacterales bacterium]|nr:hypothetical protein [Ktedonobacterales bacterium]